MMNIISIDNTNIDTEHICCCIGNVKENQRRSNTKKQWMRDRFGDGLVFRRFDERGKVFIEYMPVVKVWKPIEGKNIMVINCLWVSGKFKGKGLSTQLLNDCIQDTKAKGMDGIAVVSSDKVRPFLTDKKFYLKHGFKTVDTAPPYFELLFLPLKADAIPPKFTDNAKRGTCANKEGFTFIYSNQCPFMEDYMNLLADTLKGKMIQYQIVKLTAHDEANRAGSPFGTLGIYYKGEFVTHELMTQKKFSSLVDEITS